MAKLCPKGKAAAKRKFKVYPSAYANMYASGVCSGKITPGGKKRKKMMDGGRAKGLIPEAQEKAKSMTVKSSKRRVKKMGGGMMTQPRAMYGKGGGVCIRGMNRDAIGKNS